MACMNSLTGLADAGKSHDSCTPTRYYSEHHVMLTYDVDPDLPHTLVDALYFGKKRAKYSDRCRALKHHSPRAMDSLGIDLAWWMSPVRLDL